MKKYRNLVLILAAAMLIGMLALWSFSRSFRVNPADSVQLNHIVQTVRENWGDLEALSQQEDCEGLIVFNSDEKCVYAQKNDADDVRSVQDAIRIGYVCLPVAENGRLLGIAALPDPNTARFARLQARLLLTAGLALLLILLFAVLFGLFVYRRIILPFRNMKDFAGNIAMGRLDAPMMMPENNLFGAFSESFDIMREELLKSRQREADLKLREKELIAKLSHDMKTPVTGIKLLCELLTVKTEDDYTRNKVGQIGQKAEQLNLLVQDLLTSALHDLGEMQVQCADVSSEILHDLIAVHDTRGLAADVPVPECLLFVDQSRLSQVIANIISNSYKYANTPIDIAYRFADAYLEMDIRDHGCGVPDEELEMITTKYYRGKGTAAGVEGSGLGLYISRELMTKMNGQLTCSSDGGGLTVTLAIPLS